MRKTTDDIVSMAGQDHERSSIDGDRRAASPDGRTLGAPGADDLEDLLARCGGAARLLAPPIRGLSASFARGPGRAPSFATWTSWACPVTGHVAPWTELPELARRAIELGQAVEVDAPGAARLWPGGPAPEGEARGSWLLALPLDGSGMGPPGALVVYARDAGEDPDGRVRRQVRAFAELVRVALAEAASRTVTLAELDHLQRALESRDVIGQAKGIVMARQLCDADAAFDVLRRVSQRTHRKLYDVALEVVGAMSGRLPPRASPAK